MIAATDPANVQRWQLRDRKPIKQWTKRRATLVGDAAHPTSPFAAYGAGMATEDGHFLGRRLAGVDLGDYGPDLMGPRASTRGTMPASRPAHPEPGPPVQPEVTTTGCSGVPSGGAGSIGSVPSEPGLWPATKFPLASSRTARVGGRSAVISSSPESGQTARFRRRPFRRA